MDNYVNAELLVEAREHMYEVRFDPTFAIAIALNNFFDDLNVALIKSRATLDLSGLEAIRQELNDMLDLIQERYVGARH